MTDQTTGELAPDIYTGLAAGSITEEQARALPADLSDDDAELRLDGAVYASSHLFRRVLCDVFGPGNWAFRRVEQYDRDSTVVYHGALYVNGAFVAEASGGQSYSPDKGMNYAAALESARSDALSRCCKDLGIYVTLWDKRTAAAIRERIATQVWCRNQLDGKSRLFWRRKDAPPVDQFPWIEDGGGAAPSRPVERPTVADTGGRGNQQPTSGGNGAAASGTHWGHIVVPFGKHKSRTLGELMRDDPGYVSWLAHKWQPKAKNDGAPWPDDLVLLRAARAATDDDGGEGDGATQRHRPPVETVTTERGVDPVDENELPF